MPFDPDQYLATKQQGSGGGFDPDAYLASKTGGPNFDPKYLGQQALGLLGKAGKTIDAYTGAPMRAGIGAAQEGQNPLPAAASAFGHPEKAPTGEDIVKRAGVPEGTASKVLGVGMDMAANPLNFAGPVLRAGGKVAEVAGEAIPKIGDVVESLGPGNLAEKLNSFANEKALKAAGAMTKDFRRIHEKGMADDLGSFLLDQKLVTPGATVSKVGERISQAKQSAGETIGHILDTSDAASAPKINASQIAQELSQDPEIASLSKIPGQEGTARQISNYLETLARNGEQLSLRDAQKLRQGIDQSINFNKRVPDMAGAQPYLYKMRDKISEAMNLSVNALDSASGGEAVNRLKEANAAYSKLATLDKIAQDRLGALSSNRTIGLTDTMAGLAGAATGHTPMGMAAAGAGAALANKAGRTFGPGLMAAGARGAAGLLEKVPALSVPEAAGPAVSIASSPSTRGLLPAGLMSPAYRSVAGDKKK